MPLWAAARLDSAEFDSATIYNQWTTFPEGFVPSAAGLTLMVSPAGDLDANDVLDAADVDMLADKIGGRWNRVWWLPDAAFDMNDDSRVSAKTTAPGSRTSRIHGMATPTWMANSTAADFVQVFQAGKYETTAATCRRLGRGRLERRRRLRQRRLHHRVHRWRLRAGTEDGCSRGAGGDDVDTVGDRVSPLVVPSADFVPFKDPF